MKDNYPDKKLVEFFVYEEIGFYYDDYLVEITFYGEKDEYHTNDSGRNDRCPR